MRPKLNVKAQEGLKFYFNGKFQVLGLLARDIVIQSYCAPKTPLTKALNPLRWLINNRTIEEPIRCRNLLAFAWRFAGGKMSGA